MAANSLLSAPRKPIVKAAIPATVTATPTADEPGTFTALVAVFGNVDSQNDVIDKGAFADTINEWVGKGQPIPVIYSHDWDDPFAHIGGIDPANAQETDAGLLVTGSLDLENPTAAQVYKLMKSGRVNNFSFAATTADGGWTLTEGPDGNVVQHLTKLNLIEVGPTLRGANTETHLVSIKSDKPTLKADPVGDPPTAADTETDPDDSVPAVVASLDAVLDQAVSLAGQAGTPANPLVAAQVFALVGAAEALVDDLMELLNIPDPDDDAGYPLAKALEHAGLVRKQGRVLAQEHVDTLKDIHGRMGKLIDAVTTTSRPGAGDEPAKSAIANSEPNEQPRQQAKARLAELATRKGQK